MTRWLVIGANGFLGHNALHALPGEVHAATRGGRHAIAHGSTIEVDLCNPRAAAGAIEALQPQVVLNTAALANHEECELHPELAQQINATAPGVLAGIAHQIGARFIHISTDAVFDGRSGNYRETDEPEPFSVYGQTKLAGEHAVLQYASALVVRTNFFGWSPGGQRSILEFFVNNLRAGIEVNGYSDFTVTSLYVGYLLSALDQLARQSATGLLHVASRDPLTKLAFGQQVAHEFGLNAELIRPASAAIGAHATSRVLNLSLNCDLAAQTLGEHLPTQAQGIAQAHRDQPPQPTTQ